MGKRTQGRKIYKTKEKNYYGKTPMAKALSVALTILLIGGIGFIGYSVAEPIVNYTKKKGDNTASSTSTATDDIFATEPLSVPTAEVTVREPAEYKAVAFRVGDLLNNEMLKAAIDRIPSGPDIEYIEIPLKISGGNIYYASSVMYAVNSGAIQNMISLSDITDIIKKAGYHPAAIISTFNDSKVPGIDPTTGYVTTATGEQWIDNDYSAGGKPWMTPYSSTAVNYIGDIVTEVSSAGFEKVICSDMVFPNFRRSDLELLPEELNSKKRFQALTSAANLFYDRAVTNGASMSIEISASDLLRDNADIISEPLYLNVKSIIVDINIDEISYGVNTDTTVYDFNGTASDKTAKMLELIKDKLTNYPNAAIRISGTSVGTDELLKAKEVIKDYGFKSYVIG